MSRFTAKTHTKTGSARLGLIAVLFAVSLGSACSKPATILPATSGTIVNLTIGVPNIAGQDPVRGIQAVASLISYEGLVNVGRDGRAVPRLAESWSSASDGMTWTFKLRPSSLFHDGSPVDAHAVKASLERSIAAADSDRSPGLADILAIDTPNPRELVIRLRNQSTFLLDDLGVAIRKNTTNGQSFGTGPYVSAPPIEGQIALLAFERYYRGTPNIGRVVVRPYPTVRTAWAAMMRGEIDFLYEVGQDAREFIEGEASTTVFPFLRHYVYGVIFNARRDIFRDARIRRALNYAVDRQVIVQQAFSGRGRAIGVPAWPEHWAFDHSAEGSQHDPARASAILESAGVRELRQLPDRPAAKLHFRCLFPENLPLWERLALLVQRDLAAIGVDMQLESVPIEVFRERLAAGDFDTVLLEQIVGNSASRPFGFWHSTSKQNAWGFQSPAVDRALDALRHASNDAEYREAFRQFQQQTLDDPPEIVLALGETTRAVSKRFEVVAPGGSDILPTIADWRLVEGAERAAN
jgi:peptide/nickel transport system substrate-binding protein